MLLLIDSFIYFLGMLSDFKAPVLLITVVTLSIQRQTWRSSVASDQGLHYLQLVKQILDTLAGSEMEFFKFLDKYGKELKCQNTFMGSTVYYGIVLKWACIY